MNPRLRRVLMAIGVGILGMIFGGGAMLWALIRAGALEK